MMIDHTSMAIGGTTGLSHEHSEIVTVAAQWLATSRVDGNPVVELRKRWPLSAVEACAAVREAQLIRARAA